MPSPAAFASIVFARRQRQPQALSFARGVFRPRHACRCCPSCQPPIPKTLGSQPASPRLRRSLRRTNVVVARRLQSMWKRTRGPSCSQPPLPRRSLRRANVVVARRLQWKRFVPSPAPLARGVVSRRHLQSKMLLPSLRSLRPKMLVPSPRSLRRARPQTAVECNYPKKLKTLTSWT